MRCEGCDARLSTARLPVILRMGYLSIRCPLCGFVTPLYIKGYEIESFAEHEKKVNSWKKGDKNDQKIIFGSGDIRIRPST